jgi:hypothetical protein
VEWASTCNPRFWRCTLASIWRQYASVANVRANVRLLGAGSGSSSRAARENGRNASTSTIALMARAWRTTLVPLNCDKTPHFPDRTQELSHFPVRNVTPCHNPPTHLCRLWSGAFASRNCIASDRLCFYRTFSIERRASGVNQYPNSADLPLEEELA